jgi:hypothetical protein
MQRKITLILILLAFGIISKAQNQAPSVNERIFYNNNNAEFEVAPVVTFSQNAAYWENAVKADSKNETAWIALFNARLFESFTPHSRELSSERKKILTDVLKQVETNVPNSFSFYYLSYLNNQSKSEASLQLLQKAAEKNASYQEMWDDLLFSHYVKGNKKGVAEMTDNLFNSSIYSSAIMEYNQNVLSSVEKNGVIVTYGNIDSYPLLIWQEKFNIRKDVKIVCLEWLSNEKYSADIAKVLGITTESVLNVSEEKALEAILKSSKKKIYLGLTLPPAFLKKFSGQLYCTGLAMLNSSKPVSNIESLENNWTSLFKRKYLYNNDDINRNYLIPLVILYQAENDVAKKTEYRQTIDFLSNSIGANQNVEKYIR